MTKVSVYVTSREKQLIQSGAADAAMEFNAYVSSCVYKFMHRLDSGEIDANILTDDEPALYADKSFGTTDRQILIEPDIHGADDLYLRFYNFCHKHGIGLDQDGHEGIDPAKVVRLACIHIKQSPWEKITDELRKTGLPVKRRPLSADMPEENIMNKQEEAEAKTEQEVYALFHEAATKLGLLETKLLFLGQEAFARELSNGRYLVHAIYTNFKDRMAKEAEAAKKKPYTGPVYDKNGDLVPDGSPQYDLNGVEFPREWHELHAQREKNASTVGDRKEDYDTVGRR